MKQGIKIIALFLIMSLVLFSGCTPQAVMKYQCEDGSFVDSMKLCEEKKCQEQVCEPIIEFKDRIVEKKIETIKIICADGIEVTDKTKCIDYISTWSISENKQELVSKLNQIEDQIGFYEPVLVTKLTETKGVIEISYTQQGGSFLKQNVAQTMYDVLRVTASYLKDKKRLDYDVKITTTTSNGGYVYSKLTTSEDILKIMNYDLGMEEWIDQVRQDKGIEINY